MWESCHYGAYPPFNRCALESRHYGRHFPCRDIQFHLGRHYHDWLYNHDNYCHSIFQQHLLEKQSTFWIRRSTGRLCAELVPPIVPVDLGSWWLAGISKGPDYLGASQMEDMVANFLTLEDYHHICWFHLVQYRWFHTGSLSLNVNLGAVFCCSSSNKLEESIEIGSLPDMEIVCYPWNTGRAVGEAMEDGWTRFKCSDTLAQSSELYFRPPRDHVQFR
ncbi:hypothetical protein B0H17DRAFT_10687 [Mycena rosella]|uniref:Uncharacterized protein n=1 Tax=Mycena rosella TaxID=1033263 RepID=A0AAD7GSV3_MYCRO|nr:hypothetical protein B0H17DRAFT_10687 [Mycena rosella]